jgi:hypothetical protein
LADSGLFQKGIMYVPDNGVPYIFLAISGQFKKVNVGTDSSVEDLSYASITPPAVTTIGPANYLGSDPTGNDATSGGTWVGAETTPVVYQIRIYQSGGGVGVADKWAWSKNYGASVDGGAIVGGAMAMSDGITIAFASTTGHNYGDQWTITVTPPPAVPAVHPMSPTAERYWYCQADLFLAIQDNINEPLTWEGTNLRHTSAIPKTYAGPNIPIGSCMTFFGGRLWVAKGRQYAAGDMIKSTVSGTAPYNYRDSVLRMTENQYLAMNGGFTLPNGVGNIQALSYPANIHTTFGQGLMFIFSHDMIYSLNVPPDRSTWQAIAASSTPMQEVAHIGDGTTAELTIVRKNSDLFFQAQDGITSYTIASKDFDTWANTPLSNNVNRVLKYNDRSMMSHASGIVFDNRMLQLALPVQTDVGVAFQSILVMDLDPISTLQKKMEPAWDGPWEGLDFLQLLEGNFNGVQRAFAITHSRVDGGIEVWEICKNGQRDEGDKRITMSAEFASYAWNTPLTLKTLVGGEIHCDRLAGMTDFAVFYRPDEYPCWIPWAKWQECAARDNCEDMDAPLPCDYPEQIYAPQYRSPMTLPEPPAPCINTNGRPANIGISFQAKLVIKGSSGTRVLKFILYAGPYLEGPFEGMSCAPLRPIT